MKREARYNELMRLDALSLRFTVKKLGLNQNALAAALGVTKSAVSMGLNDATSAHYRAEMRERIVEYVVGFETQPKQSKHSNSRKLRAA